MNRLKPIEVARLLYRVSGVRDFWADVGWHLEKGLVVSTPQEFLLARPVVAWDRDMAESVEVVAEKPDCWFVWFAVGGIRRLFDLVPFPLRWFGYHRRDRIAFLEFEKARRLSWVLTR